MLRQLFRRPAGHQEMAPLYRAIVAEARQTAWYAEGAVPDTTDGRFDMVASVLALVLLRLEREGDATRRAQALLAETFVDDMDGELRQMGIGDLMVGKHVGRMMGALGGRLTAYRGAFDGQSDLADAVRRNMFRDEGADANSVAFVEERLRGLRARIEAAGLGTLLAGEFQK